MTPDSKGYLPHYLELLTWPLKIHIVVAFNMYKEKPFNVHITTDMFHDKPCLQKTKKAGVFMPCLGCVLIQVICTAVLSGGGGL